MVIGATRIIKEGFINRNNENMIDDSVHISCYKLLSGIGDRSERNKEKELQFIK